MDNKYSGFTLIEMMMAVALVSIIVGVLGQVISMASKAYTINLENTEAMTKIVPLVKRIEYDLTDTSGGAVSITAGNSVSMTISSSAVNTYWWDKDGNGVMGTPEGALSAENSTSIYMTNGGNTNVLLISNGPVGLAKYGGTTWKNAALKITDVSFTYFTTDASSRLTTVTTSSLAADYVQINMRLTGVRENTEFNYHTGFKVAR